MKKIIITILIVLLAVLAYNTVVGGYKIGGMQILGITGIKNENDKLEQKIELANQLKSVEFPAKISDLNQAAKELIAKKKSYEELVSYSREQDVDAANQFQQYEMETLWVKIGNYAKKNGIVLDFSLTESASNTPNVNDLKFTLIGSYNSITDFIYEIEKDDELSFSIEKFALVPAQTADAKNGRTLQATFMVRDIAVNRDTTTIIQSTTTTEQTTSSDITNTTPNS